jgi:hypothetical protein
MSYMIILWAGELFPDVAVSLTENKETNHGKITQPI